MTDSPENKQNNHDAVHIQQDIGSMDGGTVIGNQYNLNTSNTVSGLREKRQQLAIEISVFAVKFRDSFNSARSPLGFSSEHEGRPKYEWEMPDDKNRLDNRYAMLNRLNQPSKHLERLYQLSQDAEIILGNNLRHTFDVYRDSLIKLSSAIDLLFPEKRLFPEPWTMETHKANLELHKTVYSTGDDQYSVIVSDATERLKSCLSGFIYE